MKNEYKHKFASIILAAGGGTRMKSVLPKVMHRLAGVPMIAHVLHALAPLSPERVVTVVAPGMDMVRQAALKENPVCVFVTQDKQLGTGHAVKCAIDALQGYEGTVLVVYGDTPLLKPETLAALLEARMTHKAAIALLGMRPEDPTGYGRLVMRQEPNVERIVECKDANEEEKKIPWVWGGVMAFDAAFLRQGLMQLQPSPVTKEYYLTALIEMAQAEHKPCVMVPMPVEEAMGVNSRDQLAQAEAVIQQRLRQHAMEQGATLIDPASVYFSVDTWLGRDVVVHPQVVFGPDVTVDEGAEIRSFSHIEGAKIGSGAIIGPFARLRPGSIIGEEAHVGNFVELKKTTLGRKAKANHLSYVGDAKVGDGANIGAGTITCNYDGIHKYETVIGNHAFIGSNTSLVAPVAIGEGAIIGAGSVITEDVEADALAVTRPEQINKPAKAKEIRQRKQKK